MTPICLSERKRLQRAKFVPEMPRLMLKYVPLQDLAEVICMKRWPELNARGKIILKEKY